MQNDIEALKLDLEDLENVEEDDESDDESVASDLYSISSYGVDQTAEVLVGKLKKDQYKIPNFQRDYVWSKKLTLQSLSNPFY